MHRDVYIVNRIGTNFLFLQTQTIEIYFYFIKKCLFRECACSFLPRALHATKNSFQHRLHAKCHSHALPFASDSCTSISEKRCECDVVMNAINQLCSKSQNEVDGNDRYGKHTQVLISLAYDPPSTHA